MHASYPATNFALAPDTPIELFSVASAANATFSPYGVAALGEERIVLERKQAYEGVRRRG